MSPPQIIENSVGNHYCPLFYSFPCLFHFYCIFGFLIQYLKSMSLESSCWKGTTSIPFGLYYHGFSCINYKLNLVKLKRISNFVYCLMLMHLLKFCLSCIYDVSYFGHLQSDFWRLPNVPCGTVDIARMCSKRKKTYRV
jgi:hypothetical protein